MNESDTNEIVRLAIEFAKNIDNIINTPVILDLKCEFPEYIEYAVNPLFRHHHNYHQDDKVYDIVCDGIRRETYNIWLASNKTLAVRGYPTSGDERIRAELILSKINDVDALVFGSEKQISYTMTLSSDSFPTKQPIFTQVWQHGCGTAVPFTIWFKVGSFEYELYARTNGKYTLFGTGTIIPGQETQFNYKFYPSTTDGYIKVQIGDDYHEFNGIWGVDGDGPFEIRLGLYRHNQPVDTVLCFDNIKLKG